MSPHAEKLTSSTAEVNFSVPETRTRKVIPVPKTELPYWDIDGAVLFADWSRGGKLIGDPNETDTPCKMGYIDSKSNCDAIMNHFDSLPVQRSNLKLPGCKHQRRPLLFRGNKIEDRGEGEGE